MWEIFYPYSLKSFFYTLSLFYLSVSHIKSMVCILNIFSQVSESLFIFLKSLFPPCSEDIIIYIDQSSCLLIHFLSSQICYWVHLINFLFHLYFSILEFLFGSFFHVFLSIYSDSLFAKLLSWYLHSLNIISFSSLNIVKMAVLIQYLDPLIDSAFLKNEWCFLFAYMSSEFLLKRSIFDNIL